MRIPSSRTSRNTRKAATLSAFSAMADLAEFTRNCWSGLGKKNGAFYGCSFAFHSHFYFFWHTDCSMNFMAKKMNALQLAQTARAEAEFTNRRPPLPMGALSLMQQPRPQAGRGFPPRRRLQITVDDTTYAQLPQLVKIIHVG